MESKDEKVFRGYRNKNQCVVTLNDEPFDPIECKGLPLRFDWGNNSDEAKQLAYAILCEIYDIDIARRLYLNFMEEMIADWYADKWTFPQQVIQEEMKRIWNRKFKVAS
jgi:hypothetical protein